MGTRLVPMSEIIGLHYVHDYNTKSAMLDLMGNVGGKLISLRTDKLEYSWILLLLS
jgi:hypothetical protein